jgi:hypothetical protein
VLPGPSGRRLIAREHTHDGSAHAHGVHASKTQPLGRSNTFLALGTAIALDDMDTANAR